MKKLVVVIVVAIVGLVAYNYATTGELAVVPSFSESEEERAVGDLQQSFDMAQKQYRQAHRAAAIGGVDTTADADSAIRSVKSTKHELESLSKTLSEKRAKRRAGELASELREFENSL